MSASIKPQTSASALPSSSGYTTKVETPQSRLPSQYNQTPISSQGYYYNPSSNVASYSQSKGYASPVANQTMVTQPVVTESSSYQAHKLYQHPNLNSKTVQQVQSINQQTSTKLKRESPLDLSVKTVRTSADSTLDDSDVQERKYAPTSRAQAQTTVNYPTYDLYANSFQRNMSKNSTVGAPKVDFLPNFNVPSLNQNAALKVETRRPPVQQQYQQHHNLTVPTSAHMDSNSPKKTATQGLPRIDFPTLNRTAYTAVSNEVVRKRPAEPTPQAVPNKIQKVDVWRQTIDQQIDQRLSSYAKSRLQDHQPQQMPSFKTAMVNGHYQQVSQDQTKAAYPSSYPRPQYNYPPSTHNQTYVPTAMAHQYPGHAVSQAPHQQQQTHYPQHPLQRTNSNPSLPVGANRGSVGGAADRRVLSLLRNSLEIKGAKEAQKKLEQEQQHARSDVQQPSTDVMAPLQPKPGVVGRHNMSPFAATSIFERNTNTPPAYKFHIPKAVDSFKFESDVPNYKDNRIPPLETKQSDFTITNNNPPADLDGLAAYLAARIRTKAELKQVSPTTQHINPEIKVEMSPPHNNSASTNKSSSGGSPPKLTRERTPSFAPRRRLFSKADEEGGARLNAPPRDKSGLRSSSETSVFDFPDSDSESEMPVLERQSLEDMRRDRKTCVKPLVSEEPVISNPPSPSDPFFDEACDMFMEQLKSGAGKKRGRRKRIVEPEDIAKLESVAKENPIDVKDEDELEAETKEEEMVTIKDEIKTEVESDSDSDVPLIQCKSKPIKTEDFFDLLPPDVTLPEGASLNMTPLHVTTPAVASLDVTLLDVTLLDVTPLDVKPLGVTPLNVVSQDLTQLEVTPPKLKQEAVSESDSDSETIKNLSEKLKVKKTLELDVRADLTPIKKVDDRMKKPTFGDGTDFHPGWEEEVFRYKRSLRMPTTLISVSRPPRCHRMSTSLPDLDSCPVSPSPSIKIKAEILDSDMDSNSNFSFSFNKLNYDSEEGSSSVNSLNISDSKPKSNSILDRLIERCSARKRRKYKKKEDEDAANLPKIIPKVENPMELLPTPGLEIKLDANGKKKKSEVIKEESIFLGFRQKTIENFKDAFMSSTNSLACANEQFKTVVLNSRTRKQARVLKQKATIKEVFGEDRPASAPPVTCVDNNDDTKLNITFTQDCVKNTSFFESTKEALKNKLLNRGSKTGENLIKSIVQKNILAELPDDIIDIKREPDSKSETPSIDGDDYSTPAKKKIKSIRRKFSSGFDYIRKKKKQIKKEGDTADPGSKPKRRGLLLKTTPESVQDIQKEIKMWVMNKGVGETHLHRAARLGYTVSYSSIQL